MSEAGIWFYFFHFLVTLISPDSHPNAWAVSCACRRAPWPGEHGAVSDSAASACLLYLSMAWSWRRAARVRQPPDPRPDPIRPDPPIPTHPTRGTSTLTWPSEHVEHHSKDHIVHGGDVLVQLQLYPERAQGARGPAKAPPDTTLF